MRIASRALVLGALIVACPLRAGSAEAAHVDVPGPGSTIRVDAAAGEIEDATVLVRGVSGRLSVHVEPESSALLQSGMSVLRLVTTRVGGRAILDPLPPLERRATVVGSAPVRLVLRVRIPEGTPAGTYSARLAFAAQGRTFATLPLRLRVFAVQLPTRSDPAAFRTLFLVAPQTYVAEVVRRTGADPNAAGPGITDRLYGFLSDYRVSPGDWGYGMPWPDGYVDRPGWFRAAATRMAAEGAHPFRTMRLPLGTQHSGTTRTGQSARAPETAAAYLSGQVMPFWRAHGWLDRALVWGWDEPGPLFGRRYVAPQACAVHAAGAAYLTTGSPARDIEFLWDDRGCDDVDVWAVLSRRFYGTFATPAEQAARIDAQRELRPAIRTAKRRGASIWSFTYEAGLGSPGYAATEPPTDARVFGLWNALEGTDGTLYADGITSYAGSDPYGVLSQKGQHVLVYPALEPGDEPVSSLRFENVRDGIEDADLARMVIARRGRAALLAILARERIFSIAGGRLLLGCTSGCDLVTQTKYAWPVYRRGAGTRAALERVHTALLAALAPAPGLSG